MTVENVDLVNLDLKKFNNPVTRKELVKDLLHGYRAWILYHHKPWYFK